MAQVTKGGWRNRRNAEECRNDRIEAKIERRRMFYEFQIKQAKTLKGKLQNTTWWMKKEIELGTEESQAYVREVISKLNEGV
jgi:hypothetical protein